MEERPRVFAKNTVYLLPRSTTVHLSEGSMEQHIRALEFLKRGGPKNCEELYYMALGAFSMGWLPVPLVFWWVKKVKKISKQIHSVLATQQPRVWDV